MFGAPDICRKLGISTATFINSDDFRTLEIVTSEIKELIFDDQKNSKYNYLQALLYQGAVCAATQRFAGGRLLGNEGVACWKKYQPSAEEQVRKVIATI